MSTTVGIAHRPAGIRFRDLGRLVVERDGQPVPLAGGRLFAALAMLLIHADRRVGADALVEAMWGSSASTRSATTLASHVWRLRKMLEPERDRREPSQVLLHDVAGYRLLATAEQVDSLRFERLAADVVDLLGSGQPERALRRAEEALELWRGRPFTPAADEPWAEAAVARLEELHAQLLERQVEALLAVGEPERALVQLETALRAEPLRERLWLQRMLACHRAGRTDQALQVYGDARRVFLEELGVEPGPELRQLHGRILAEDPTLSGPRRAVTPTRPVEVHLPGRLPRLIGRERELARLAGLVTEQRLVVLVGVAGCGKTRLAVEVAGRAAEQFPDGVWFVDLTSALDGGQLVDAVVSTLGLAAPTTGSPIDALRSFTRHRRMLLVLDNCEHVLDAAAALVDELLADGTELATLATSREPLDLVGEVVVGLDPLPVPAPEDPDAADAPAVALFLDRLAAVDPDAAVDQRQLRLAVAVCAAVDGVPLALELAAARARAFTLEEIVDQVSTDPSTLARIGRRGSPDHHRTVRTAVEQSYAMLPADQAQLHRSVSVVPGPFTASLAAALTGRPPVEAGDAVAGLVHRSLLVPTGALRPGGGSRFAQLAIVRGHAQHAAGGEVDELRDRRDRWVVELARAQPRLGRPEEAAWFAALDDDLPAVRATLQRGLVEAPAAAGLAVLARLGMYWYYRGMMLEQRRWLERAVAVADRVDGVDRLDRAMTLLTLGGCLTMADRYDLAVPHIEAGLAAVRATPDEHSTVLVEGLGVLVGPLWAAQAWDAIPPVTAVVRAAADQTGDAGLHLIAETCRLVGGMGTPGAAWVQPTAAQLYDQALDQTNAYVAWIASVSGAVLAMLAGDVEHGLHWTDRGLAQYLALGVGEAPILLEVRANLLVMAGRTREAVRTYGAVRAHDLRAGLRWPTFEVTTDFLAAARAALDRADADSAWAEGGRLTLADLDLPAQPPIHPAP